MYPYQYQMYQPQMMPQQQAALGVVSVRSMQEAQNYPVAPGNSVMFRDENAPYVYTKTMGYSQLDRPTFERYRLVKEEITEPAQVPVTADRTEIEQIRAEIERIKQELGMEEKDESDKHDQSV